MHETLEAIVDADGSIRLLEPATLPVGGRLLVTLLADAPEERLPDETALLSEAVLAEDWSRAEEDRAWSHLQ